MIFMKRKSNTNETPLMMNFAKQRKGYCYVQMLLNVVWTSQLWYDSLLTLATTPHVWTFSPPTNFQHYIYWRGAEREREREIKKKSACKSTAGTSQLTRVLLGIIAKHILLFFSCRIGLCSMIPQRGQRCSELFEMLLIVAASLFYNALEFLMSFYTEIHSQGWSNSAWGRCKRQCSTCLDSRGTAISLPAKGVAAYYNRISH